jgi:adenine-specific DNA-methyltransferase
MDYLPLIYDGKIQLIVTSPPYNLNKDYEDKMSLNEYITWQKQVIHECARILNNQGSICWQVGNYVDKGEVVPIDILSYKQFKDEGLILRNRIIWTYNHGLHAKNRLSGRYETIMWFTKTDDYIFNLDPIRVPQKYPNKKHYKGDKKGQLSCNPLGKNPGDVWEISNVKNNHPEKTEHPCQFPELLVERLVLSLSNPKDMVLDPFAGSGTVGAVCEKHNRDYILIEKEEGYCNIIDNRLKEYKEQTKLEV